MRYFIIRQRIFNPVFAIDVFMVVVVMGHFLRRQIVVGTVVADESIFGSGIVSNIAVGRRLAVFSSAPTSNPRHLGD